MCGDNRSDRREYAESERSVPDRSSARPIEMIREYDLVWLD